MFKYLKSWLIRAFVLIGLICQTNAELLLLKRYAEGQEYYPVDSQTYPQENLEEQAKIKHIFKEILMVYQWPMITTHFFELDPRDQKDYLHMLKNEHGVTLFIQKKLDENYGEGSYKVHFVPTTLFELAAINSFMNYIINTDKQPTYGNNRSIFPEDDIRNGDFIYKEFKDRFAGDILEGLRTYQDKPNADIHAMKNACDRYNQSDATFEMFLQTTAYLINNFKQKILQDTYDNKDEWENTIINLIKWYNQNETLFDKNVKIKEKGFWGYQSPGKFKYNQNNTKYASLDMIDSLVKGTALDCESERKNNFMLWRGTGGLQIGNDQSIIDSPYRESRTDYAEALKDWPDPLTKDFLSIKMDANPSGSHNSFVSFSLSYANSLMAGTFYEASASGGARALDYLRKGYGYALVLPIAKFFKDTAKPSLREKYLVSSLDPLVALFSKGEYFHSRSKISLFDPKKEFRAYSGIKTPSEFESQIPELDRAIHAGFIVTSGVDWPLLRSSISHDIAANSVWIKEPWDASSWVEAQKNFARFSSLEVAAFKDHFLKFQPVLEEIKKPHLLKPTSENVTQSYSSEHTKPLLGSKVQTLVIPETSPVERLYQSNVFTKIIENPANQNTTPIINMPHSLSFNDLRKRTKEHALVIPKSPYVSFSHFIDFATPEEIVDLMQTIAQTASQLGISETGYRIITNNSLNPGTHHGNDANQEVPHFHIHIAGGECLGSPVVGSGKNMEISLSSFGKDWTPEQLYEYANAHKIGERGIKVDDGKKRRLLAYRIEGKEIGVTQLVGFLILDEKRQSVYKSIHHFSENASPDEMKYLLKFINDVSRHIGIDKSGFRLVSNFGNDAGQYPRDMMNIMIAGGNPLGITVANMYGNYKVWQRNAGPFDYTDLTEYPHEHCPPNAFDAWQFLAKIKNDIPEKFKELALDLSKYKGDIIEALQKVPDPKVVIKMNLTGRKLKELPEIIQNFTSLEELDLHFNDLESLPEWIGILEKIKCLNINENKLQSVPEEIGKLLTLEKLYLSENVLESLPDSIGNLVNLKQFLLEKNKLTSLPESMQNLKKLEKLYLSDNKIESLPEWIGELVNLKKFLLEENKLTSLPESMQNLKELEGLYLSDNEIGSLPEWIGHLKKISQLDISDNKLESLPDEICDLINLKILTLKDNKLTTLPENIGTLTILEKLDLQNNNIISLPESIQHIKFSWRRGILDLRKNPNLLETAENGHLGYNQLSEIFGKKFKN